METRQYEEFTCNVLRGKIVAMSTRGVSFGKNTNSFFYEQGATINGMPRYDSVVLHVWPDSDTRYWGNSTDVELWNSQMEQAIALYGEFHVGDEIEVLKIPRGAYVELKKVNYVQSYCE